MKKGSLILGMLVVVTLGLRLAGCDSGQYGQQPAAEPKAQSEAMSQADATPQAEGTAASLTPAGAEIALSAEEATPGAAQNNEGVSHYAQGHWDVARDHFQNSIAENADLAEAHFNLALALDKLGDHGEATNQFKMALNLGQENPKIASSAILLAHVGE